MAPSIPFEGYRFFSGGRIGRNRAESKPGIRPDPKRKSSQTLKYLVVIRLEIHPVHLSME
ncbi:MAG TPA: hypothetical protein VM554_07075 [Acidisarcina sp.]|nr:hypothetical protein [Acidisarcina sp.]